MVKQRHFRLMSIVVLVAFGAALLSACAGNTNSNTSNSTANQLGTYNSPDWWNGQDCDKGNYPQAYVLTTWRGIQVCGPIPWKTTGNKDVPEDFHGHGVSQLEFECPELVARYLLAAYGLDSLQADGWQIVDQYTGLANSPFHKVVNDGTVQMAPVEGDVLSYGTSDPGHASIVTNSNVDGNGNGTIDVIEQNVNDSGTATLTLTNWVIQHDANHIGTVASWMTTRPISSQPTPTPTQAPAPVPTPTQPVLTSGTWQGQGTITSGSNQFNTNTFPLRLTVSVNGDNTFSGTLDEAVPPPDATPTPAVGISPPEISASVSGTVTGSSGNSVDITFTDNSGCTFTATVSDAQMNGTFSCPNNNGEYTSGQGTFSLTKTS